MVGFDDILEAQYASPPLTTVRSPFDVIGRAAAEQLLAEFATVPPAQPSHLGADNRAPPALVWLHHAG